MIQILNCDLKLKKTVNDSSLLDSLSFLKVLPDKNTVQSILFEYISKDKFEGEVIKFMSKIKKKGSNIQGKIVFVEKNDDDYRTGIYNIAGDGIEENYQKIKILPTKIKQDEPKKRMKQEEKIALFKEFYDKYNRVPEKNETYKDFNIGKFVTTAMNQKVILEIIEETIS